MAAAGTADADNEIALPFLDVSGEQKRQQRRELVQESVRLPGREDVLPHALIEAGASAQFRDVVRIRQKTCVQHDIRVYRDAVLVAEGDNVYRYRLLFLSVGKELVKPSLKLTERQIARVDDIVRPLLDGVEQFLLVLDDCGQIRPFRGERMAAARLLVALDDRLDARLNEEYPVSAADLVDIVERLEQLVEISHRADVRHQRHALVAPARGDAQLGKLRHERDRHVIDAVVVQILQDAGDAALARAGEAGDYQNIHLPSLSRQPTPQLRRIIFTSGSSSAPYSRSTRS